MRHALNNILRKEGKLGEAETLSSEIQAMQKSGGPSLPDLGRQVEIIARRGKWKEALAEATKMIALGPKEHLNYHTVAPLQVQVRDLDGYRKTCRQAVAQFR